jgi:hypothetical protein
MMQRLLRSPDLFDPELVPAALESCDAIVRHLPLYGIHAEEHGTVGRGAVPRARELWPIEANKNAPLPPLEDGDCSAEQLLDGFPRCRSRCQRGALAAAALVREASKADMCASSLAGSGCWSRPPGDRAQRGGGRRETRRWKGLNMNVQEGGQEEEEKAESRVADAGKDPRRVTMSHVISNWIKKPEAERVENMRGERGAKGGLQTTPCISGTAAAVIGGIHGEVCVGSAALGETNDSSDEVSAQVCALP